MKALFDRVIDSRNFTAFLWFLLTLVVLAGGFYYWEEIRNSNKYRFYYLQAENLPGEIMVGSPVNLFGLEVGRIESVVINSNYDGIEIRLSVLDEVSRNLSKDARLVIVPKLFGAPELKLEPGKNPGTLGHTGTLGLVIEKSADHLIRENLKLVYKDIIPEISNAVDNFSKLGERLSKIDLDQVNPMIKGFERNIYQANIFLKSMTNLQADLKDMMGKVNSAMENMVFFTEKINSFAETTFGGDEDLAKAIKRIVANTESVLENINGVSNKTEVLLTGFDKTGGDVNAITEDLMKVTETLPKLIGSINKMVDDFSLIGMAMQRHWLLKGSVKKVEKEIKRKARSKIKTE